MSDFIDSLLIRLHGEWPGSGNNRDDCQLCDDTPDVEGYVTGAGPVHDRHDLVDVLGHALEQGTTSLTNTEVWLLCDVVVAYVHVEPTHVVVAAPFWTTPTGTPTTALATESTWIETLLGLWGYPIQQMAAA